MSLKKTLDDWANDLAKLKGARGDASEKEATREILRRHAQKYGVMGAGAGEALYQGSGD